MLREKYDRIGLGYNRTRKADPWLTERLWQHLSPGVEGIYLDIGCGTGNYTGALQEKGARLVGVDPSAKMLETARARNRHVRWMTGKAEDIPLADTSMEGAIASLTIHHWADLHTGFRELSRVLKPGGRVVIFTSTPRQMQGYWLNHYFPRMLADSMVQMPSLEAVEQSMEGTGLEIIDTEKYFVQPDLEDLFLYSGKHDPSLYLDPQVRQGISSFSALANAAEVGQGLSRLQSDIESGDIDRIVRSYTNDAGDYLFIIARKQTP